MAGVEKTQGGGVYRVIAYQGKAWQAGHIAWLLLHKEPLPERRRIKFLDDNPRNLRADNLGLYGLEKKGSTYRPLREGEMPLAELQELFVYDVVSGELRWRVSPAPQIKAGALAGGMKMAKEDGKEYRYVTFRNFSTPASRVAWALGHGVELPNRNVFVKDGNPENLRLDNLELRGETYETSTDENGVTTRKMKKSVARNYGQLRNYGITGDEADAMDIAQGGVCKMCGQPPRGLTRWGKAERLHTDHDHKTGKIRARLCLPCNSGLGSFGDDTDLMAEGICYVAEHRGDPELIRRAIAKLERRLRLMDNVVPLKPPEAG